MMSYFADLPLTLQIFKFFSVLAEIGLHPEQAYACAQLCACYLFKTEYAYQAIGHKTILE